MACRPGQGRTGCRHRGGWRQSCSATCAAGPTDRRTAFTSRAPRAAWPHAVPVRALGTQRTQCTQTANVHATMRVAFSPERGPPWGHGAHNEAALNRGESVCLVVGGCAAAAYTPSTYIRRCWASASWACCAEPLTSSLRLTNMTLCPNGLRGRAQAPSAQVARVQSPQAPVNCFRGAAHARMAGAQHRPQHCPQQWRTPCLGRSGGARRASHPLGRTVHPSVIYRGRRVQSCLGVAVLCAFRQTTKRGCFFVARAQSLPTCQHPECRADAAPRHIAVGADGRHPVRRSCHTTRPGEAQRNSRTGCTAARTRACTGIMRARRWLMHWH